MQPEALNKPACDQTTGSAAIPPTSPSTHLNASVTSDDSLAARYFVSATLVPNDRFAFIQIRQYCCVPAAVDLRAASQRIEV
jgi:hypothetical protein